MGGNLKIWKKLILSAGLFLCTSIFVFAKTSVAQSKNTAVYTFSDFDDFLKSVETTFNEPSVKFAYLLDDSSIISNVKLTDNPWRWSLYQINSREDSLSQTIYFVLTPSGREVVLIFTDAESTLMQKNMLCEKSGSSVFEKSIKEPILARIHQTDENPFPSNPHGTKIESAEKNSDTGKVLNVYLCDEAFRTLVENFYPGYDKASGTIGSVKVKWHLLSTDHNVYQQKLSEILEKQSTAADDEKVDIFLLENDYAMKFALSDYTLDVYKDVGLDKSELSNQFKYTKDFLTDSDGALKAVSWQACPAGLIYRRSIAKKILGTDDPDEVQKKVSDWEKFDEVAALAKKKGYKMLSGFQDDFRVFSENRSSPWLKDGKVSVDGGIRKWISQSKIYTQKGYNNKAESFSDKQWEGLKKSGKVMCYFGPSWFINIFLQPNSGDSKKGSFGDWAFCKGPQSFSWGGTWFCAATGTDNLNLIRDIMKTMTCDTDVMMRIAREEGEFVNNLEAMEKLSESDYKNEFLGGQNHIKQLVDIAKKLDKKNATVYDLFFMERLQESMREYIEGRCTEEKAWADFKKRILKIYPDLTFDF